MVIRLACRAPRTLSPDSFIQVRLDVEELEVGSRVFLESDILFCNQFIVWRFESDLSIVVFDIDCIVDCCFCFFVVIVIVINFIVFDRK